MNKIRMIKMMGKLMFVSAIIFMPMSLAFAYELCPKNIAPKAGKYVIMASRDDISRDTINLECVTFGQGGDIVRQTRMYNQAEQSKRFELAMQGKATFTKLEEDEKIYFSGRLSSCTLIIGGKDQAFYAKECPDPKQKGKFYFDFNGQKSNSFAETAHDEKISEDGKIFSATLWYDGLNNFGPAKGKTEVLGAKKKVVFANAIFDKSYNEYASSQQLHDGPKKTDIVYYNGEEIARYEDYYQVAVSGLVKGKGPIYITQQYLPGNRGVENAVYVGRQLLYKGGCSIGKVMISPDEKHYAIAFSDASIDCTAKKNTVYDGRELANTPGIINQDTSFGFSDNGKFYYVSKENGKYFFNFNGKKTEVGSMYGWQIIVSGDNFVFSYSEQDNFAKGFAGVVYNGKKVFERKTSNGLIIALQGILPKGKGVLYQIRKQYQNNRDDEGEGTYLNSTLLKDGCYYDYYYDPNSGDLSCMAQTQKNGSYTGYVINGKVLIALHDGENLISSKNNDFVISRYSLGPDSKTGKVSVQYLYNGKVFASLKNVYLRTYEEELSDDGRYLAVFYFEGNNLIKEVFKVK